MLDIISLNVEERKGNFIVKINRVVSQMTIEQKIGQLFMPTFHHYVNDGNIMTLIEHFHIGGVLLAIDDFTKKKEINKLNRTLQSHASRANPLLIATDYTIEAIEDIHSLCALPREESLQALNNRVYTKQFAEVIAQEFSEMGINSYLYPRLTIHKSDQLRHEAPTIVNFIYDIVQGLRQREVISFVEGFPLEKDMEPHISFNQRKSIVFPFHELIKRGIDVLLVSETSSFVNQKIIRESLHFNHVIAYRVKDSFLSIHEVVEDILQALNSGVDLIILPFTFEEQVDIFNHVFEKIKKGEVSEAAIDRSAKRLLTLKDAYKLHKLDQNKRPLTKHQRFSVKEKIVDQQTLLNSR